MAKPASQLAGLSVHGKVEFSGSVAGWPAAIGVVLLVVAAVTFIVALVRTATASD